MNEANKPAVSGQWQHIDQTGSANSFAAYLDRGATLLREERLQLTRLLEFEPGCSVLDVGSGAGEFLIEAASSVEDIRAVGIDVSEAMVAVATSRAREAGVSVEFRLGDAQRLDFPDATFDRVNCSRVLVHLDDPGAAIAEMTRVLAPGGRVGISEPDFDAVMIDSDDLEIARAVRRHLAGALRNPDIGRRLRRLLLDAGLEILHLAGTIRSMPDLETVVHQFHLRDHLDSAVRAGDVGRDRGEAWWRGLEAADAAGRFFIGGVLYRAVATKPVAPATH